MRRIGDVRIDAEDELARGTRDEQGRVLIAAFREHEGTRPRQPPRVEDLVRIHEWWVLGGRGGGPWAQSDSPPDRSRMARALEPLPVLALELERRVLDVEVAAQAALELVEDRVRVGSGVDDHVGGENVHAARDRPYM